MPLRGSNVVMKFFIMNESSIPAEAGSVMVAVDTNVSVFFADPGWGRFESDAEFLPGFVGRTMDLPTLAHDSGIRLPEVTVLSSKAALEGFNVAIRASAKSGPDASAAIRVIFLPDKRLKRPVVLQGRKNKDGKFEVNPLDALK